MTGFGRSSSKKAFVVEILSVNSRKYLEIFVSLPKELSHFEYDVRKWIGEKISRGQVTAKIQWTLSPKASLPDVEMLRKLKKGWEKIADAIGADSEQISLPFLLQTLPVKIDSSTTDEKDLRHCIDEALSALLQMKEKEGRALAREIEAQLDGLKIFVEGVEKLAPESTKRMREKLREKMEEVASGAEIDERIYREVALFAEKVDISEEIARLHSHFDQFRLLFKSKEPSGRKMEFLVQEIGREINTIGSKSAEAKISHLVVEMKSALEKIREQIQNVE